MVVSQRHASAGLDQGAAFLLRLYDQPCVLLLRGEPFQIIGRFLQIDLFPGRPEGKNLLPFGKEIFIRPAVVIQFNFLKYFLTIRKAVSGYRSASRPAA